MDKDRKEAAATHIERTTSKAESGDGRPADCQSRVLVVDDNPLNAKLALAQLEQGGYEATAVESGEAALVALASTSYLLVLMDCGLPGTDGCDTTREIRRREAPGRHTVVVGLSSNTAAVALEKCLEAGMDGYIARPVTTSQLMAQLQRLSCSSIAASPPAVVTERPDAIGASAIKTLDANVVAELVMLPGADGGPLLLELIGIFLRHLPELLRDLSAAAGASPSELAGAAHRLKSASTTIGGSRLASLCESIELDCGVEPSTSQQMVTEARNEAARLAEMLMKIPLH
jgi:CheY-like chemotaxis protein/HPt (histidine-containing phosphotransfer) domain-containing protein